jgi:hypothetical protein
VTVSSRARRGRSRLVVAFLREGASLTVPVLCLLLCVFLFPIAIYCWALAAVNRRPGPVMVSGPGDFIGLLFAGSGFLLVVGPALITGLYYRALRELPLAHQWGTVQEIFSDLLQHQWGVWLGYYLFLVAGSLLLLYLRRRKTIIYNVEPAVFEIVLTRALARLGINWLRQGNRYHLGTLTDPAGEGPAPPVAVLIVQTFGMLYNVTLNWRRDPVGLRLEVEIELERELAEVRTDYNPAGAWLLGVAACLFAIILAVLVLILTGIVRR